MKEQRRGIATADAEDVETFLAEWAKPQTRANYHSDLRMFYAWAVRRGQLKNDPTTQVDRPKVPEGAARPIEAADVLRLVSTTTNPERRRMVMFAAYAGLRTFEIAAIRGEHIRFAERLIEVRDGKGGKDRILPLATELAVELAGVGRGAIFPDSSANKVAYRIGCELARCGIEATPHQLRHSWGTRLAQLSGGNMNLVQALMGHSSMATTQRYVKYKPLGLEYVDRLYGEPAA